MTMKSPKKLTLSFYICALLMALPNANYAFVHTRIDTLVPDGGFDFSLPNSNNPKGGPQYTRTDDFDFLQLQDLQFRFASDPVLFSTTGIRDMGPVSFESVINIPQDLQPDPETTANDLSTGEPYGWIVPLHEGHLYVLWTKEGHFAKILIEDVVPMPEFWPDRFKDRPGFYGFINHFVFRWAYQDDGSRSFDTKTGVKSMMWGEIKNGP